MNLKLFHTASLLCYTWSCLFLLLNLLWLDFQRSLLHFSWCGLVFNLFTLTGTLAFPWRGKRFPAGPGSDPSGPLTTSPVWHDQRKTHQSVENSHFKNNILLMNSERLLDVNAVMFKLKKQKWWVLLIINRWMDYFIYVHIAYMLCVVFQCGQCVHQARPRFSITLSQLFGL